jgi:transcriptional regulator with XRE-family HTH domain
MSIDLNLAERIKLLRMFHGWTQEEMAEKLDLAASSYAKIERGQTDVPFSRLQQIAEVFKIELEDFFRLNEKNVFNIIGNSDIQAISSISSINIYTCEASKFQHENEKLKLIIEQKNREIELLQQQLIEFKEIIALLKHT